MPLYEYNCTGCGKNEEKLQSMSAPQNHDCPFCGVASGMKRMLSAPSFSLTGSGWYAQGYSKEGSAPCKAEGASAAVPPCCAGCDCK